MMIWNVFFTRLYFLDTFLCAFCSVLHASSALCHKQGGIIVTECFLDKAVDFLGGLFEEVWMAKKSLFFSPKQTTYKFSLFSMNINDTSRDIVECGSQVRCSKIKPGLNMCLADITMK